MFAARETLADPLPRSSAPPIDLATIRERESLVSKVHWCLTSRDATRADIAGGACRWQPLTREDTERGFERGAVWMHLRVRNSAQSHLERWLEIGYPRVSLVEAHYRSADGQWRAESMGFDVPRSQRRGVAGNFGAIPLWLAARGETDVWVRVQSDSRLSLESTLWEPEAFRTRQRGADVFLALALGGLVLGGFFSLFAYVSTRDVSLLMVAIGIAGTAIIEMSRSGFFYRYFWPPDWPFPVEIATIGSAMTVLGFTAYIYGIVPTLVERRLLDRTIRGFVILVIFFQLYSIFVDHAVGTTIWGWLVMPLPLIVGAAALPQFRSGDRSSFWGFLACMVLAAVVLIRSPLLAHRLSAFAIDAIAAPLLALLITALVMLSLVERMSRVQKQLVVSRNETASQVAFLARMSHELRTPLDNILGNAQLMQRAPRLIGESGRSTQMEVAGILQSGRHLLGLVDEILDYARGVSGALRLNPEPVTVRDFLASVETGARLLAARHRNEFFLAETSDRPPPTSLTLMLDRGRLRQVIDNLVANAARHTHDGVIRLDYRLTRVQPKRWQIDFAVSDTGEGIAAEDIERIFQPFERAGRAAQYGGKGAGMGLAIARQLVELMGGGIEVESSLGKGSVFRFSIVASAAEIHFGGASMPEESLPLIAGYEGRRRVVLVVDDDAGSRAILAGALKNAGFEVREAESGHAALTILSSLNELDAVITDQFMPDGDGWVVLEGVSRQRAGTPCVLVSAAPPMAPKDWSRELRFAAVFLKPLDHGRFLRTLGNLLELRWLPQEQRDRSGEIGAIAKPEPDELAELAAMIEFGEVTAIGEWARRLRQRMPMYAEFADRVEIAATDLDFDTLNSLVKTAAVATESR